MRVEVAWRFGELLVDVCEVEVWWRRRCRPPVGLEPGVVLAIRRGKLIATAEESIPLDRWTPVGDWLVRVRPTQRQVLPKSSASERFLATGRMAVPVAVTLLLALVGEVAPATPTVDVQDQQLERRVVQWRPPPAPPPKKVVEPPPSPETPKKKRVEDTLDQAGKPSKRPSEASRQPTRVEPAPGTSEGGGGLGGLSVPIGLGQPLRARTGHRVEGFGGEGGGELGKRQIDLGSGETTLHSAEPVVGFRSRQGGGGLGSGAQRSLQGAELAARTEVCSLVRLRAPSETLQVGLPVQAIRSACDRGAQALPGGIRWQQVLRELRN